MPTQAYSQDHKWVAATNVPLAENLAKHAARRGTVRVPKEVKVDVLDVTCDQCRRRYSDVSGAPCAAAINRDHLIGGPTGERKKRIHAHHDCALVGCEDAEDEVG